MQCLSEKLITNTLLTLELDPAEHTKERWERRAELQRSTIRLIGHFTVMDGSEVDGDLVLIQTFLLYYVNQVILMLTSIFQGQFP